MAQLRVHTGELMPDVDPIDGQPGRAMVRGDQTSGRRGCDAIIEGAAVVIPSRRLVRSSCPSTREATASPVRSTVRPASSMRWSTLRRAVSTASRSSMVVALTAPRSVVFERSPVTEYED